MRSLNLDQLRAFVEVVERGSFTVAAKELNLTQPAVTHQVQELERRFQVALVERFGKRAYLTQAGEKLIEHARNLLDEDSRTHVAMRRFGDGWLGRVRVGTSMTVLMYVLPPILRQLKTDHPQLEIKLKAGLTTNAANAEDQRARPGSVRTSDRGSGVRDGPASQRRACRNPACRARAGSQKGNAGISFPVSADPRKRKFGIASNDSGLARTRRPAAEAIDGVR